MTPFKLGNWLVFPKLNKLELSNRDHSVQIMPKLMALLVTLKQREGEPVNVEQLIAEVWVNKVVADSSVYQAIAQLRKVLNMDTENDVYIERISGQGYRIAPSIEVTDIIAAPKNSEPSASKPTKIGWLATLFASVVIVAALVISLNTSENELAHSPYFESLTLASHLTTQKNPEKLLQAKQLYLDVLKQDPNNVEALNGLCNSYRLLTVYHTMTETQRDSLCQPLLEQAFNIAPNDAHVLASMARQAFELGNMAQSEQLFNQAFAVSQNEATTWHWFGRLKRSQNQVKEALTAHQKAFKLAPNDPIILRGLAYAHLNNRDLSNARKYYERSVLIAPNFRNRPLFELDFYPLNQNRAKNYLTWYRQNKDGYLKKYPSHKLSYIIFLLSLNQGELANNKFKALEAENSPLLQSVPTHFLLYTQAALAWHQNQHAQGLDLLQKRYAIAPEQNQFVMPYLFALIHQQQPALALRLFKKHFPDVVAGNDIANQLGQHLLLAKLYKLSNQASTYQTVYARLLTYRQSAGVFVPHHEVTWLALNNDQQEIDALLQKMLRDGWLPDYNDSIFSNTHYMTLQSEQQAAQWSAQLAQFQYDIWHRTLKN